MHVSTIDSLTGDNIVSKSGGYFTINFHATDFYPIDNLNIEKWQKERKAVTLMALLISHKHISKKKSWQDILSLQNKTGKT